ncbi:hypothetical protein QQ045_009821 [Rhodiola kirilowii]
MSLRGTVRKLLVYVSLHVTVSSYVNTGDIVHVVVVCSHSLHQNTPDATVIDVVALVDVAYVFLSDTHFFKLSHKHSYATPLNRKLFILPPSFFLSPLVVRSSLPSIFTHVRIADDRGLESIRIELWNFCRCREWKRYGSRRRSFENKSPSSNSGVSGEGSGVTIKSTTPAEEIATPHVADAKILSCNQPNPYSPPP